MRGLNSYGSGWGQVEGSCEDGNTTSGVIIIFVEFLGYLLEG